MVTTIRFNRLVTAAAAALAFSSGGLVAHAASVFGITYPIAELGGCTDRVACKDYCDDPTNQSACAAFAHKYDLTVQAPPASQNQSQEAGGSLDSQTQAIRAAITQDGGPGQCGVHASDPVTACRDYCDSSANIQACVVYGKTHNIISGERLQQAQKVASALANGVQLPAGCTDAQSCRQTCENPSSLDQAKSCFGFAKAAGILPPGFNEAAAEKVFSAIQSGSSPFSSIQDFQKCQNPTDPALIKTCTDFAVGNGLMTQEQATTLQETGGKGPGACQGRDSCDQYCSTHQDECFRFAQDHNLITPEQQDQMKQAAAQVQDALNRAPDTVKECVVSAVGQDTLDAITSGTEPGSPQIGQKMRACFQQYQQDHQSAEQQAPSPPGMERGGEGPQFGNSNDVVGSSTNPGAYEGPPQGPYGQPGNYPPSGQPYGPPQGQDGQMSPRPGPQGNMPPGANGQYSPAGMYGGIGDTHSPTMLPGSPSEQYNPTGQNNLSPPQKGETGTMPQQYLPRSGDDTAPAGFGQYPPSNSVTPAGFQGQPLPPGGATDVQPPPPTTSFLGGVSQAAAGILSFILGR